MGGTGAEEMAQGAWRADRRGYEPWPLHRPGPTMDIPCTYPALPCTTPQVEEDENKRKQTKGPKQG